jgi:glycosyltransferase involved in cell wall biosynthesis
MPGFNAEKTLPQTAAGLPDTVDIKILVDDCSSDRTLALPERLGLTVYAHDRNYGYGRNQQTCYREASPRALMWWSCCIGTISTPLG